MGSYGSPIYPNPNFLLNGEITPNKSNYNYFLSPLSNNECFEVINISDSNNVGCPKYKVSVYPFTNNFITSNSSCIS